MAPRLQILLLFGLSNLFYLFYHPITAQQIQLQVQPGNDKSNECGMDGETISKYGNYRCVFRQASDSLYVLMKNTKTKRAFTNTFSKATLTEMDWKGSIDKMVKLLEEACAREKHDLTFKVAFGDSENNNPVSYDALSRSYMKGHALYVFVAIEGSYLSAQYAFKLLEQRMRPNFFVEIARSESKH